MNAAIHPMMPDADMVLWSAAAGALGLVVLLALADTFYSRTRAASQTLAYLALCWVVVMLLSGLPAAFWPDTQDPLAMAQILAGPLCAAMGSYGASQWLSAHQRDHLMKVSLLAMTLLCLAGGPLCLLLAPEWRLPVSGALAIANLSVVLWLSVRATQLGDRMAWGLAIGCLLTLPAQIGLYGLALNTSRLSLLLQAGVAMAALLSVLITAAMLWLRNRQIRQMMQGEVSRRDPITQLYDGVAMVQKIIRAQRRRQRTRRDGALMAVLLFEPERLLPQIGQAGLNDIYIQLARRMQRHTGTVNPAGRYYDRCFVVLLETMHSPRWIRTLGLRVATSLRRRWTWPRWTAGTSGSRRTLPSASFTCRPPARTWTSCCTRRNRSLKPHAPCAPARRCWIRKAAPPCRWSMPNWAPAGAPCAMPCRRRLHGPTPRKTRKAQNRRHQDAPGRPAAPQAGLSRLLRIAPQAGLSISMNWWARPSCAATCPATAGAP
jgi:hypothetical protein